MDESSNLSLRQENRLAAVQFLYMWEMSPREDLPKALHYFFVEKEKVRTFYVFAEELIAGTLETLEEIDETILKHSQNWAFDRIAKVDLAILRLAIHELLFRKDIPPIVSINEAIDLTKMLSNVDSKRFVNGILDKIKETLNRPLRSSEKN